MNMLLSSTSVIATDNSLNNIDKSETSEYVMIININNMVPFIEKSSKNIKI